MIQIKNLTKSFGAQLLFSDITLHVNSREKIGLVGRNGHGKSTLLRIIEGKDTPDMGEIMIPNGYKIGVLNQHIKFSKSTLREEVALSVEKETELWKAEKMCHGLGFSNEDLDKDPADFSGGFQIRIMLAKLLLTDPDLLLLDEPTNYLDIVALAWLTDFLQNWKKEFILVTHDRVFMDRVVTHTVAIHRGQLKKVPGNTYKVYNQINEEEDIHEKTRKNDLKKRGKQEKFIREFRSGARSAGLVQSRIKMLEKQESLDKLAPIPKIRFNFTEQVFTGDRILAAHSLTFGYDKDMILINKLDLDIYPGDRIAIIGKNGRGKSTLLKLLSHQLQALTGSVRAHPSAHLGIFNQTNQKTLDLKRSVFEELHQTAKEVPENQVRALCGSLMFTGDMAYKKLEQCSGGERARVALGKIMLKPVCALMLDEPTNHFDLESIESLINALNRFEGALVAVSHSEELLEKVANKLVIFDNDQISVFNGTYSDFLREKGWYEESEEFLAQKELATRKLDSQKMDLFSDETSDKIMSGDEKKQERLKQKELRIKLRPVKRKIEKVEKEIEIIEQKMSSNKDLFDTAFRQGNRLKMETLGLEYDELQNKVVILQEHWDDLSEEYLKIENKK